MKSLLISIAISFFAIGAQAADVVCSCTGEEKCSDVKISFVPATPGVYMSVEYSYGDRNQEGFATITRIADEDKIIYRLGNFTLVEEDGKYSLPLRKAKCN